MNKLSIAALTLLSLTVAAATASAETPATAERGQVGAALKYGIYMGDTGESDLNPYGIGLGVNGGYTLGFGLFVGGQFDYYFGGSEETEFAGSTLEFNAKVFDFMGQVGYDIGLSPDFVLRPQAGVGLASFGGKICAGGRCESPDRESHFALVPGVKALYDVGPVMLTGEASYQMVFVDEDGSEASDGDAFVLGLGANLAF